eukprot:366062-Chlamydomonas_euryale.AAC.9
MSPDWEGHQAHEPCLYTMQVRKAIRHVKPVCTPPERESDQARKKCSPRHFSGICSLRLWKGLQLVNIVRAA